MSRILLVCAELGGFGGVERLIATLAPLLSSDHEVHVASFDPAGTNPGVPLTVPFHALGGDSYASLLARPITYLTQISRLRRLESALGIDVTISNLWRADLISALAGGCPRRIALAHINVVGNPTNRLMIRLRPLVSIVYRRFDRLVTVSNALARELTVLYRLDPAKVRTIWNAVARPQSVPPPATSNRIVWCGRMVPEKTLPALVAVFAGVRASHPDVRLDLIGDGPDRTTVLACAAERGLAVGTEVSDAPIILRGRLSDPSSVIAGAKLLALPSSAEGFGLVLVEAMALGVPVIAADCASGGVHEVLAAMSPHDPGRALNEEVAAGLLLPVPKDEATIERWSAALTNALSNEPKRVQWAKGALTRAAVFAPETILAQWSCLLTDVLA